MSMVATCALCGGGVGAAKQSPPDELSLIVVPARPPRGTCVAPVCIHPVAGSVGMLGKSAGWDTPITRGDVGDQRRESHLHHIQSARFPKAGLLLCSPRHGTRGPRRPKNPHDQHERQTLRDLCGSQAKSTDICTALCKKKNPSLEKTDPELKPRRRTFKCADPPIKRDLPATPGSLPSPPQTPERTRAPPRSLHQCTHVSRS